MNEDNVRECPICKYELDGHSFDVINKTDYETYFYTCPIFGKDHTNVDQIIAHIHYELSQLQDCETWTLVIDCSGLHFKHMYNYDVAKEIIHYFNDHIYNLNEIIIINQNWKFNLLYKIIQSYASDKLLSKIKYDRNNEFNNLISMYVSNRR